MDITREHAISWFSVYDDDEKMDLCIKYNDILKLNGVGPKTLTGLQIQKICICECEDEATPEFTINNKDIKDLSFKDKYKVLSLLFESLPNSEKHEFLSNSGVIDWYKQNCY